MAVPSEDRCPRCGGSFHCGIGDAGPCPCTGITLGAALQQQLPERYTGCLCLRCLQALAAGAALQSTDRESPGGEGEHTSHNGPAKEDVR